MAPTTSSLSSDNFENNPWTTLSTHALNLEERQLGGSFTSAHSSLAAISGTRAHNARRDASLDANGVLREGFSRASLPDSHEDCNHGQWQGFSRDLPARYELYDAKSADLSTDNVPPAGDREIMHDPQWCGFEGLELEGRFPGRFLPSPQLATSPSWEEIHAVELSSDDTGNDTAGSSAQAHVSRDTLHLGSGGWEATSSQLAIVIDLQHKIRAHTKLLLKTGIIDPASNKPYAVLFPSARELDIYARSGHPEDGPSMHKFKVDIISIHSRWNKQLAAVFAEDFVVSGLYGYDETRLPLVANAFLAHLRTLRLRLMEQVEEDVSQARLEEERLRARNLRETNVKYRRRHLRR